VARRSSSIRRRLTTPTRLLAWMTVSNQQSQIRDRQARVDRRRGQQAMTEQRLHVTQIGAAAHEMCHIGVAHGARRECDPDPQSPASVLNRFETACTRALFNHLIVTLGGCVMPSPGTARDELQLVVISLQENTSHRSGDYHEAVRQSRPGLTTSQW